MALNEVKFKQGQSAKLVSATTLDASTIYASIDKPVLAIGGQLYYGQPTIEYKDDKIVLWGVKDTSGNSVELGSIDLTLESFLEYSKYYPTLDDAKTGMATDIPSVTSQQIETAYNDAFGDSYTGFTGAIYLVNHVEHSSGDTHVVVVVPLGKIIGSAAEISSTNKSINVTTAASGKTIDVNNDVVTIKQYKDATTNGFTKEGITENELYAADAVIEEGFKVLGKNVGNLNSGTDIEAGTTVIELLKQILVKEADCTAIQPSVSLAINPTTTPVEVGTVVNEVLTTTYSDGKFTGDTEAYGKVYNVAAGCVEGDVTYSFENGDTTKAALTESGTNSYTDSDRTIAEGDNIWYTKAAYAASTVTPKKNTGEDSSVSIAEGVTTEISKTIVGKYKWYLGNTTATSVADIVLDGTGKNVSDVVTGWTETASTTTMKSTWSSNGKSIFVLVKGTLSSFKDNLSSESLLPNFDSADKSIAIGGTSTATYKGYLWTITNGAVIAAKEIKMTK